MKTYKDDPKFIELEKEEQKILDMYTLGTLSKDETLIKVTEVRSIIYRYKQTFRGICRFSGGSDYIPNAICCNRNNPMGCNTCRVASEYDECYG